MIGNIKDLLTYSCTDELQPEPERVAGKGERGGRGVGYDRLKPMQFKKDLE